MNPLHLLTSLVAAYFFYRLLRVALLGPRLMVDRETGDPDGMSESWRRGQAGGRR